MASKSIGIILNLKDEFSKPLKQVAEKIGTTEKELKDATNAVRKFQNSFEKSLKKTSRIAGIVSGAIAVGIGAIGVNALKTAGQFEQYNVSFQTMLGSQQKATKLMGEITKFAAATPFEMPALVEGSRRMIAFGIGADVVVDRLGRLGDLSQGNAEVLDRLTLAYGKIKAKGKASLEELNQLTEAGVPIMAELAKQQNITTGELFGKIRDGAIGYTEVEKAVISLTSKGGQFYNMNLKQSKTLNGVISTLSDSFNIMAAGLMQKSLPQIKAFVTKLIDSMPKIEKLLTVAFNAALPVLDMLLNSVGFLVDNMNWLVPVAGSVLGALTAFNIVVGIASTINTMTAAMNGLRLAQQVYNIQLTGTKLLMASLGIGLLIMIIAALVMNWDKVTAAAKKATEAVKSFFSKWGNKKATVSVDAKETQSTTEKSTAVKKPPGHALGTPYFQGGATRIDEGGRDEVINLPNGSSIMSHNMAKKLTGGGLNVGGITVNIQGNVLGNKEYADYIGNIIVGRVQTALGNI